MLPINKYMAYGLLGIITLVMALVVSRQLGFWGDMRPGVIAMPEVEDLKASRFGYVSGGPVVHTESASGIPAAQTGSQTPDAPGASVVAGVLPPDINLDEPPAYSENNLREVSLVRANAGGNTGPAVEDAGTGFSGLPPREVAQAGTSRTETPAQPAPARTGQPAQASAATAQPAAAPPAARTRNVIDQMFLLARGNRMVLVIEGNNPVTLKYFTLEDPIRLVVDLGGLWYGFNAPSLPDGNSMVKRVRVGRREESERMVLDLLRPVEKCTVNKINENRVELIFE